MVAQFLAWYVVVQLIALLTMPLTLRFLRNLPDRGYGFARSLGILLVGYGLWIAYSFGLLHYEPGSAWLIVVIVGTISVVAGWQMLRQVNRDRLRQVNWWYVGATEVLFLAAFLTWAYVRAHDPAANHTEKPMDLMFMNSIRSSATYPPMDAWLAGHPISYYYFGYWLLTTVGMLAGQPPEIAYNLGQACWFALLLTGCFAVAYNVLAALGRRFPAAAAGGLGAALFVGLASNLQGLLEWLYANGVDVTWAARLFGVAGFPQEATVTHQWFIDYGWWWWRSSRVVEDLDLSGNHIEVIDEFPAFSYILGDNHPHVLAMPFVLLVIAVALNLLLAPARGQGDDGAEQTPLWRRLYAVTPLGWGGWGLIAIATGALLFLNTWDYPPYWLLLVLALFASLLRLRPSGDMGSFWRSLGAALAAGVGLAVAGLVLYLPYFLTAQSQAEGIAPNLFNPTKVGQFTAMYGMALLLLAAGLLVIWPRVRPHASQVAGSFVLVYGAPALLLVGSTIVALRTEAGKDLLARMALPAGGGDHLSFILARWSSQPFTFLLVGALLALFVALGWSWLAGAQSAAGAPPSPLLFVVMLAAVGLALVYAPEFVFLRDNFGTRMNTIFKFYYQAWLLFGLVGAVTMVVALGNWRGWRVIPAVLSALALAIGLASTIYLVAGAYSKTNGLAGEPSFDATAYLQNGGAGELAAVRWVRENTLPGDIIAEGKGASYRPEYSRISAMTGRPTLLGWDGHESQWRGRAYGQMAAGRPEALETIYKTGDAGQIAATLKQFGIDYVYVGPAEREQYAITPQRDALLQQVMDLGFENEGVRIYRAR